MSAAAAGMLKKINDTLEKHFLGDVTKVDNGIVKMDIIEFSFDDWFDENSEPITIPHSLGTDPDTIVILPSHHDWIAGSTDFVGELIVVGAKRTWHENIDRYTDISVEYFDEYSEYGYGSIRITENALRWTDKIVTIYPFAGYKFAPKSELTYKMLVIRHT